MRRRAVVGRGRQQLIDRNVFFCRVFASSVGSVAAVVGELSAV